MNANLSLVVAAGPEDVERELRFETLNQNGLVRAGNAKSQWFLLVSDAWSASGLPMDEVVRDYLVTMLERFTARHALFEQFDAFDYSAEARGLRRLNPEMIQDVADMALQYVAFFPYRTRQRHKQRSETFIADIGVSLYQDLARASSHKDDWTSKAYQLMANLFGRAVMILRAGYPTFTHYHAVSATAHATNGIRIQADSETTKLRKRMEANRIVDQFNQIFEESLYPHRNGTKIN